ncbi:flavin-containing monooxygenase [Mycobacterium servetii]|uniref:Flavin-containing monooxygenase n=1 Tax=Mycobacterium servetii TaxID=3237418 RepID=A0ABV4C042_9MYCO
MRAGRIGVIGAGIAGLVTAKVLREDGFEVIVFEKEQAIGGVWTQSRTYPGLRTNNSRDTYAFSDHPYDRSADIFPSAEQVRAYLASYVARFELAPLLRLSTEVVRVSRHGNEFTVESCGPTGLSTVVCDFAVVCAGTFSEPDMPAIDGADRFTGTVVHSSQATNPALFAGRRVVIVGAGKSALDCAAWAGSHAQECTLVFRKAHWMMPRYFPGGIPADRLTLGRSTEAFFRYHHPSLMERLLHGPGKQLTNLVWRVVSLLFRFLLRMPAAMVPDEPMPTGIENLGFGKEFYDMARRGRLVLRRDSVAAFLGGPQVLLASGDQIAADIVVFATGWRQPLSFLAPELRTPVVSDGRFQLYRHILPPTEQRLGFVGYASSTACQLSSEISAHWLSRCFRGELALPSLDEMQTEIRRVQAWLEEVMPARPQGYQIGPHLVHHIDDLLADMGLPTRRTSNFVSEYFGSFSPTRYRNLAQERRPARGRKIDRRRYYLSAQHALAAFAALTLVGVLRRHNATRRRTNEHPDRNQT